MRRFVSALAAAILLCAPALADEISDARGAIDKAGISPEADLLMWCGAAYTVLSVTATDEASKASAGSMATALFTKAAPALMADGNSGDDLATLGGHYGVLARAELITHSADPEHDMDECASALD